MDKLYIVIPAYNEEENIAQVVDDWYPVVEKYNGDGESRLVIIDDGSKDNTYEILKTCAEERPLMRPLTTPPIVSPSRFTASTSSSICLAVAGSGQRTRLRSASASLPGAKWGGRLISPICEVQANTSMPTSRKASWAKAPAQTWAAVARAEERPPPRWSRTPYLA